MKMMFEINEKTARLANDMNSMSSYESGRATRIYESEVNEVYEIVERIKDKKPELFEKAEKMAERYSRKLAEYYNDYYRNEASCPSILISGGGNFPVRKKERQNSRRNTLIAEYKALEEYRDKIGRLLTQEQPILSDDERAVEMLENKLENLEKVQEKMKKVNAYYRKNKTVDCCPELTDEEIEQLKIEMTNRWHYEDKPYMSWALSNNNANIRATKARLEKLKSVKESGNSESDNEFFKVVENAEIMRLQIFFDEKPDENVRSILKSNGFRWSPRNGCWQRQLTDNAKYSLRRIMAELKRKDEQ